LAYYGMGESIRVALKSGSAAKAWFPECSTNLLFFGTNAAYSGVKVPLKAGHPGITNLNFLFACCYFAFLKVRS
jgi:hypothetical protein